MHAHIQLFDSLSGKIIDQREEEWRSILDTIEILIVVANKTALTYVRNGRGGLFRQARAREMKSANRSVHPSLQIGQEKIIRSGLHCSVVGLQNFAAGSEQLLLQDSGGLFESPHTHLQRTLLDLGRSLQARIPQRLPG